MSTQFYSHKNYANRYYVGEFDPYYSNVSLLLHMDGTNGSTTFTDNSANSFTPTVNGNAQISTTQSKFGGASCYFDGTGDYLSYADNAAFNISSGDFTVECFVYVLGSQNRGIFSKRNNTSIGYAFEVRTTGEILFRAKLGGTWNDFTMQTATGVVPSSTLTHIAFVRYGNLFTIYVDGASKATLTSSSALDNPSEPFVIGRSASSTDEDPYYGYIDEFRFTKGVARYISNFTPPTIPFLNN